MIASTIVRSGVLVSMAAMKRRSILRPSIGKRRR
jgi:hypothetical protein